MEHKHLDAEELAAVSTIYTKLKDSQLGAGFAATCWTLAASAQPGCSSNEGASQVMESSMEENLYLF